MIVANFEEESHGQPCQRLMRRETRLEARGERGQWSQLYPSIHRSMGSAPVGVQCFLTSSLGEFLCYWDWLWCPGLSPVLVFTAYPFTFHISVFFHSLFTCHWISFVFPLSCRRVCTH